MEVNDNNFETLLSSIITSTSIMVAVGIPLILYIVANYKSKREDILKEMKSIYPKFNYFRELIYNVFQIDFWKNTKAISKYENSARLGNKEEMALLINEYEFLNLYSSYKYISEKYSEEIIYNNKRVFTHHDILEYIVHANRIWYAITCRKDYLPEIDMERLNNLKSFEKKRITESIAKLETEEESKEISIFQIADISGEMEGTIIDSLSDLTWYYEKPLNPIVKHLSWLMALSFVAGVILPLLILMYKPSCSCIIIQILLWIIICCFISTIFLTGKYVKSIYNQKNEIT
ncbi:MAG: hypothetical protein HXX18_15100 [Bacteroidetes bacterium]|nr:hypothetical protein [Bacteroidota bacterium]